MFCTAGRRRTRSAGQPGRGQTGVPGTAWRPGGGQPGLHTPDGLHGSRIRQAHQNAASDSRRCRRGSGRLPQAAPKAGAAPAPGARTPLPKAYRSCGRYTPAPGAYGRLDGRVHRRHMWCATGQAGAARQHTQLFSVCPAHAPGFRPCPLPGRCARAAWATAEPQARICGREELCTDRHGHGCLRQIPPGSGAASARRPRSEQRRRHTGIRSRPCPACAPPGTRQTA